ncbi:hypothetical protein SUGI_0552020 [Cryptomeria japonica]|nr:hypothetical protein SUGI_0552020 [Cryptomeria japonica]
MVSVPILMGDLSLQLQHHLKYSHFNGSPESNLLNLGFINGTPNPPTTSKARAQSLSSKTRTYPPNFHNPRFKITNPATKIKGNPVRRRVELDRFRRKKPIPGYIRSWDQNNMAAVYEDLKLLCQEGQLDEALTILRVMDCRGDIPVDANIYDFLLEGCKAKKYLHGGRQVHNHMMLTDLVNWQIVAAKIHTYRFPSECLLGNQAYSALQRLWKPRRCSEGI